MVEIILNEIDPKVEGQEWFVCSFINPKDFESEKIKSKAPPFTAFKFRGAYPTEEKARKRAEELSKIDPAFDVLVGNSFRWIIIDAPSEHAEDIVYHEEKLNEMFKALKEDQAETKRIETQRRMKARKEALDSVKVNDKPVVAKVTEKPVTEEKDFVDKVIKEKDDIKKSLQENMDDLKKLIE